VGDVAERNPVDFHFFTVSARNETEAAAEALRAAGVEFAALQPPGSAPRVESVLSGTATTATLAGCVAALRHHLRHGVVVRPAGPGDVVVRSDAGVAQGLIVVRARHRDTEVRDAAALCRALDTALAEFPPLPDGSAPAPYAPSALFRDVQNIPLAAEAVRFTRVFADPGFLRAADPTSDLLDDPGKVTEILSRPRLLLDLLLLAHAFSRTDDGDPNATDRLPGMDEARRIASTVEVLVQPSTDPEGRTLMLPQRDGGRGFVIGVPPRPSELMANLSWVLPTLFGVPEGVGGPPGADVPDRERVWRDLDDSIASYLQPARPGRAGAPPAAPRSLIPRTMPPGEVRHGPGDPLAVFDACTLFLIARELVPILMGRLGEERQGFPLPSFTAGLPRDVGRETMADCSAYVLTINALILGSGEHGPYLPDTTNVRHHFDSGRPSRFPRTRRLQAQARRDGLLMLRSVDRVTEALLSYYAVAEILAALARARGESTLARHLEAIADRRETACAYVLWLKWHGLPESWGLRTWREGEEERWEGLQEYVRHVRRDLVPTLVAEGRG
jgi:hypothetical protein